jgi:hypothetical protein
MGGARMNAAQKARIVSLGRVSLGQFIVELTDGEAGPQLVIWGDGPEGVLRALSNIFVTPGTALELDALAQLVRRHVVSDVLVNLAAAGAGR